MTITEISSMIVALATVGSLLYISRQVNVTRQQTRGQFLLALDQLFDKTTGVTMRLVNEPDYTPIGPDWYEIFQLMSIFERISIMVEDNILDAGLVDRLYGFRLIKLISNDAIYKRITETGADWQDFIDLCYAIADHRQKLPHLVSQDTAFIARVHKLSKDSRNPNNPFGTV